MVGRLELPPCHPLFDTLPHSIYWACLDSLLPCCWTDSPLTLDLGTFGSGFGSGTWCTSCVIPHSIRYARPSAIASLACSTREHQSTAVLFVFHYIPALPSALRVCHQLRLTVH